MTPTATDKKSKRRQRIRIILWSLLVASFVTYTIYGVYLIYEDQFYTLFPIFVFSGSVLLLFLSFSSKHYYNYGIAFMLIILISLTSPYLIFNNLFKDIGEITQRIINDLFRVFNIPLAAMSMLAMSIFFLVFAIRLFFLFPKNKYIQWFGFFVGVIVITAAHNIFMMMGNFRLGSVDPVMFNYITMLLITILSLALIFMLPRIDIASWLSKERKILYRMIIAPLALLLVLNILFNVFPDFLPMLLRVSQSYHWGLQEVELLELEGI